MSTTARSGFGSFIVFYTERLGLALRFAHGFEQPETEVAGEAEGEWSADRRGEADFQQAAERIGLHAAALPAKVVEGNQLSV